jgi:hypothetical protein
VEKNDGKADYILRRLFKAYFSNPHQLPDEALERIKNSISQYQDDFFESFEKTLRKLLGKFKNSLPVSYDNKLKKIEEICNSVFYKENIVDVKNLPVEIKYLIEDGEELRDFIRFRRRNVRWSKWKLYWLNLIFNEEAVVKSKEFRKVFLHLLLNANFTCRKALFDKIFVFSHNEKRQNIFFKLMRKENFSWKKTLIRVIFCHSVRDKKLQKMMNVSHNKLTSFDSKKANNELRGILDNSVLGAIPVWKRLLVRGICDHIAGMTDQEAISEYEKLYTGLMELV